MLLEHPCARAVRSFTSQPQGSTDPRRGCDGSCSQDPKAIQVLHDMNIPATEAALRGDYPRKRGRRCLSFLLLP